MLYSNQTEHDKYKTNAALFPFLDTSEPNPRSQNEKNNFQLRSNQKQTNHYHPIHNKKVKKWRKKKPNWCNFSNEKSSFWKWGLGFWEMLTGTGSLMSEIQSPQKQRKSLTLMWVQIYRNSSYMSFCVCVRVQVYIYVLVIVNQIQRLADLDKYNH